MRITDTLVNVIRRWKIKMISENEMLVGYASLTFDNVFVCVCLQNYLLSIKYICGYP